MATRKAKIHGPTTKTVAANIRRLRERVGWSVPTLATRTKELGYPVPPEAIHKIEAAAEDRPGARRINVDELTVLAVALSTTPNALMLPTTVHGNADVTGVGELSAREAWKWARGEEPLPMGARTEPLPADSEEELQRYRELGTQQEIRRRRFQQENRPDDVPDFTDFGQLEMGQLAALDELVDRATAPAMKALDRKLSWKTVVRYLALRVDQARWERHQEYLVNRTEDDLERERQEGKAAARKILGSPDPED
ncbi:hypothetical protein [Nocardiopsis nanhaiensis]